MKISKYNMILVAPALVKNYTCFFSVSSIFGQQQQNVVDSIFQLRLTFRGIHGIENGPSTPNS